MITKNIEDVRITVIGDIMIDRYIRGEVERISPEAPVPIIVYEQEDVSLGGAGNVAENLSKMGCQVNIVSCCGIDRFSTTIKDLIRLDSTNITPYLIDDNEKITTVKTRIIGNEKQIARIDIEDKSEFKFNKLNFTKEEIENIFNCDCIIISDYGKGFITEDVINFIDKNKNKSTKILIDPHIRNVRIYKKCFLIKPNKKEFEQIKKFIPFLDFEYILRTEGSNGSSLFTKNYNSVDEELRIIHEYKSPKVDVVDITGAGDVTISVMSILLSMGYNIKYASNIANIVAGISVTKEGTTPITKNELTKNINQERVIEFDIKR